jgi:hypothetical protein
VRTKRLLLTVLLIALTALVAAGTTVGIASGRSQTDSLTGTWMVTIPRPAPLPPLTSLQVFTSGGGVIEMANESPAGRTAQYGRWERIQGRLYAASGIIYQFDDQGKFMSTAKINRTIELGRDRNTLTYVARVAVYNTNDKMVTSFVARATGVRMPIERIPDVP